MCAPQQVSTSLCGFIFGHSAGMLQNTAASGNRRAVPLRKGLRLTRDRGDGGRHRRGQGSLHLTPAPRREEWVSTTCFSSSRQSKEQPGP